MNILTDPALLIPKDSDDGQEANNQMDFWVSLAGWAVDNRLRVSENVFDLATNFYNEHGYPHAWSIFPREVKNECQRAVSSLLQRVIPPCSTQEIVHLDPPYDDQREFGEALELDIGAVGKETVLAIACAERTWTTLPSVAVQCTDLGSPTVTIELLRAPNESLPSEEGEHLKSETKGKTLLIFGAKIDSSKLDKIKRICDFKDIRWFESEPEKHIRDIDKKISGRRGSNTIVVLVTGFISHAESEEVERACRSNEIPLRQTRYPGKILHVVRESIQAPFDCGQT
ncbi:DUF2325 domain-containing protein [Arsenicicoccus dermatophilus]|uniref:DUF2325 domain-containing protein n=1 Tax=Arsenicicoccus dermatophilus TaxID=1076331 RepID=UPI001F4C5A0E|nr:DUF2325 domain-containing protein [Arsenicicoccus dermatophilus]MCH8611895.1 DUF2325 domain-containing protein [Arsenicicoccus dermatophilus]